tara:strand:+ start:1386 stop:1874 length:489 start_codon:yes stop_codon:yes gene_type:complete
MRVLVLLILNTTSLFSQNEFRLNKTESFNIGVVVDPNASIKEKGLNIGVEIEYVGWVYARASATSFAALTYGYADLIGASGLNFTSGPYDRIRYYTGGRFGFIQRSTNVYPTAGLELGIDYRINDLLLLGLRGTSDKRNDFKIYNTPPVMRQSGFIKLGFKL